MTKIDTKIKPQVGPKPAEPPPPSAADVKALFDTGKKITERQIEGEAPRLQIEIPCPACGQEGMIKTELLTDGAARAHHSTTCTGCKRFFTVQTNQQKDGGVAYEIVKNSGPDLPKWFTAALKKGNL